LPYYAQLVQPWIVSLIFSQEPSPSGTFEIRATINSGIEQDWRAFPMSNTTAKLTLPSGYDLVSGNKEVEFQLDSMGQAVITWQVNVPSRIDASDFLNVLVSGVVNAESYSYETYTDTIGAEASLMIIDGTSPEISDVAMDIGDNSVRFTAAVNDENELQKVELHWRKTATNWSYIEMEYNGNNIWKSNQDIPFLDDSETLQVRVIAEDVYDNTAETDVLESTEEIVPDLLTPIILSVVLVVVIIAIVIIIRKRSY
jgi:hypothetical protein